MNKRGEYLVFFGVIALYFGLLFSLTCKASSTDYFLNNDNKTVAQDEIDNALVHHQGADWRIKTTASGANKQTDRQNLKSIFMSDGFVLKESPVAQQFIKNSRHFFLKYAKTDIAFPFSIFT